MIMARQKNVEGLGIEHGLIIVVCCVHHAHYQISAVFAGLFGGIDGGFLCFGEFQILRGGFDRCFIICNWDQSYLHAAYIFHYNAD